MTLAAFTQAVVASFADDALTFTEEGTQPVTVPYREHPQVFGHPRFLMADFDTSVALVRRALLQLKGGRFPLLAPKIVVSFDRPVQGGIADMDKKLLQGIFAAAGARKVEFRNA